MAVNNDDDDDDDDDGDDVDVDVDLLLLSFILFKLDAIVCANEHPPAPIKRQEIEFEFEL